MKRFFALVCLLIFMMTSLSASAEWELPVFNEDFSIRNGILFHMRRDEVIQSEAAYGTDISRINDRTLYIIDDSFSDGYFDYSNILEIYGVSFFRAEAEYPSYRLHYFFDNSDCLIEMCYLDYGDNQLYKPELANEDYFRTLKMLEEKYGKPLAVMTNGVGSLLELHSFSHSAQVLSPELRNQVSIKDCSQWIIQYNDCFCLIELTLRKDKTFAAERGFVGPLMLSYRLYDYDEFQEVVNTATEEKRKATQDY